MLGAKLRRPIVVADSADEAVARARLIFPGEVVDVIRIHGVREAHR